MIKIDNLFQNFPGKYYIEGENRSGKTKLAIEIYKKLVENNVSTQKILVINNNPMANILWREELLFNSSNEINNTNYYSFIKKELELYWPIVVKKTMDVYKENIKPIFITYDMSFYVMKSIVNKFREDKNMLLDITASNEKISRSLINNMKSSSDNFIPFKEIGNHLFYSLDGSTSMSKKTYADMDAIINHYTNSLMSNGILDYAIAVNLYNEVLLKDNFYKSKLKDRFDYIIIDDFQKSSRVLIDLINSLKVDGVYIFSNIVPDNIQKEYLLSNSQINLKEIALPTASSKGTACSKAFKELYINNKKNPIDYIPIKLNNTHILRGSMITGIVNLIKELKDKGYEYNQMVIINPIEDEILENEINEGIKDANIIKFFNNDKLINDPSIHSLLVICSLCKNMNKINLTQDHYTQFFINYFELNVEKAVISAMKAVQKGFLQMNSKNEKYKELKKYIEECIHENYSLDKLLEKVYIDLIVHREKKIEAGIVKFLIETSKTFIDIIHMIEDIKNPEQEMLSMFFEEKMKINKMNMFREFKEHKDTLFIMSPDNYIDSGMTKKIQIWADTSSNMWSLRNKKELSNPYAFKGEVGQYKVHTEELEDKIEQDNIIYKVSSLLNCATQDIYLFACDYSKRGYEQDNKLYNNVINFIEKFGESYEL